MTDPPQAAVDGNAVMSVRQHLINHGCTIPIDVIRGALEAAAPHIVAAERERIRRLAITHNATASVDCACVVVKHESGAAHHRRFADLLEEPA